MGCAGGGESLITMALEEEVVDGAGYETYRQGKMDQIERATHTRDQRCSVLDSRSFTKFFAYTDSGCHDLRRVNSGWHAL